MWERERMVAVCAWYVKMEIKQTNEQIFIARGVFFK